MPQWTGAPPHDQLGTGRALHFHLADGVDVELLIAALLDAGADPSSIRRALDQVGLSRLGFRVAKAHPRAAGGLSVTFVDDVGRALGAPEPTPPPQLTARSRRRSTRQPQPDRRARRLAKSAPIALFPPTDEASAAQTPSQGSAQGADAAARSPVSEGPQGWLTARQVLAVDLLGALSSSKLPPVERALAHQIVRRFVDAHAEVAGRPEQDVTFDASAALAVLTAACGFAGVIAALSPARVTASPVPVSDAPVPRLDGWTRGPAPESVAALRGVPTDHRDEGPSTTPLAACALWAVAHQFGPCPFPIVDVVGRSVTARPPVGAALCQAWLGPLPADDAAQSGNGRAWVRLDTQLPGAIDRPGLMRDLSKLGAVDVATSAALDEDGQAQTRLFACVPSDHEDDAHALLLGQGAAQIWRAEVFRRAPKVRVVTVALGPRFAHRPVRVQENLNAGQVVYAAALPTEVSRLARELSRPPGEIADAALAAYAKHCEDENLRAAPTESSKG